MENREPLINTLLKNFLIDLKESIQPFTEVNDLTYFAETLKEYNTSIYNTIPENDYFEAVYFDEEEFIRIKLLSKYRDKMIPFIKTSLKHYFAKDEFNQIQLFQKLKITEPILNDSEFDIYISCIHNFIIKWLERLYLLPINTKTEGAKELPKLLEQSEQKTKSNEYTRSRQLLLFYYLTQVAGINRNTVSVRNLAQFAHYLFNYPNDNIDNSEVYKQLKKAPEIKVEAYLLKDLEFVKKQFELLEHTEAISLIDKQIKRCKENK